MFIRIISTVFFIGYFPYAPGTICSAFVMLIVGLSKPSDFFLFFLLVFSFVIGTFAANRFEKTSDKRDPSCIVIDEFSGYLTSIVFIPLTWENLLIAFVLFRFFDIVKPPPIRQIEKKFRGGLGIMIDDIMAGFISNILIRIFLML